MSAATSTLLAATGHHHNRHAPPAAHPHAPQDQQAHHVPGSIAAAAAAPGRPLARPTSLLTSALGAPVHPFLSANAAAPPGAAAAGHGDAGHVVVLEQVLDKWDKAWMGSPQTTPSGVSPAGTTTPQQPPTAGTSPSSQHAPHAAATKQQQPHTTTTTFAHGNGAVTTITTVRMQGPTAAPATQGVPVPKPHGTSAAAAAGTPSFSSSPILRSTPVPNFPATPPPAHRPLSMAHLPHHLPPSGTANGIAAAAARAQQQQHHRSGGAPFPVPTPPPHKAGLSAASPGGAARALGAGGDLPSSTSPGALLDRPSPDDGPDVTAARAAAAAAAVGPDAVTAAAVRSASRLHQLATSASSHGNSPHSALLQGACAAVGARRWLPLGAPPRARCARLTLYVCLAQGTRGC